MPSSPTVVPLSGALAVNVRLPGVGLTPFPISMPVPLTSRNFPVCSIVIVPVTSTVNPLTENSIDGDCSGWFKISGALIATGVPGVIDENTPVFPIPTMAVFENAVTMVAVANEGVLNAAVQFVMIILLPAVANEGALNVAVQFVIIILLVSACAEGKKQATANAAARIARRDFDNFIMLILVVFFISPGIPRLTVSRKRRPQKFCKLFRRFRQPESSD